MEEKPVLLWDFKWTIKKQLAFPAFVIQFSFIACFFWLNAMCMEMWSLVRVYVDRGTYRRMKPRMLFFWYSLWCWGPSVILNLVSMIMDLSPMIPATYVKPNSKKSCSFKCKWSWTRISLHSAHTRVQFNFHKHITYI